MSFPVLSQSKRKSDSMRMIAELNVLLRVRAELPVGLKMATDEFREGWKFVRSGDVHRLEKRIRRRGWNFIKIADGELRSGVGDTAQLAIASALKLALRRVSEHFNAVEVEHIELTRYPWFCVARVRVFPYRIQESAVHPVPDLCPDEAVAMPVAARQKRAQPRYAEPFPDFASEMPMLKEMLIASANSQVSAP
jgi:hypothetical protein